MSSWHTRCAHCGKPALLQQVLKCAVCGRVFSKNWCGVARQYVDDLDATDCSRIDAVELLAQDAHDAGWTFQGTPAADGKAFCPDHRVTESEDDLLELGIVLETDDG